MKYAKFVNTKLVDYNILTEMINIGDSIQSFAIDNLFEYAGIDRKSVIEIPFYGDAIVREPCYLIIQGHFGRQYDMAFVNNPDIYPIFIGFGLKDSFLLPIEVEYFKKYQPILCRDEFTKNVLSHYGIEAYISGCLTETFAKRNMDANAPRDKYYFVDIKESFQKMIPEQIRENAVFTSQNLYFEEINNSIMKWAEQKTKEKMEEYKTHAKMVITSKLHCMTPCMAMGIPTIAVGNNFSYRYSFIDTFIDAYDEKRFEEYDWSIPQPKVDIEVVKKLLLDVGKSMIEKKPDMDKILQLDRLYSQRSKWDYCQGIKIRLREVFKDKNIPAFILWGASSGGYAVYEAIKELWPENRMMQIVDSFSSGIFEGQEVKKPDIIKRYPDVPVIISTISGRESAEEFLKGQGRKKDQDYFIIHENL